MPEDPEISAAPQIAPPSTGRRLRVAYVSPLPPARSGIADYSAELLPALAEHLDLELYSPAGAGRPALPEPLAGISLHPLTDLAARSAAGGFDLALCHLGNEHRHHGEIYRQLTGAAAAGAPLRAVVMLHEYVLHHMLREMTLVAGDPRGYVEEMFYAYGRTGGALARRAVDTGIPLDPWSYPLFERAVDASLAVVVHNRTSRRRVLASRPGKWVAVVPHHVSLGRGSGVAEVAIGGDDPESERRAARQRLGDAAERLGAEDLLVGTFGFQTPPKRLDVLLRAFARLRAEHPRARLAVVGEVDSKVPLDELFAAGLGEGVLRVGRVRELDRFLDWMRAVDVAVNLRHPAGGETSGTVIRLLGLGRPLVVTDAGAFAEIPDGCAAKVPPDEREEAVLTAYLEALAADPPLRRRLGAAARRHMAAEHTLAGSARGYAGFLGEVAAAFAAGELRPPPAPVPPRVPWPEDDLLTELAAVVAADAADLGVTADHEELLEPLAAALVGLDLDRAVAGAGPAARRRRRERR